MAGGAARVDLDLFAFLTHQTNLDRFEDAVGERWTLFEFIRTAHEHAFLARIVNLFDPEQIPTTFQSW